MKNRLNVKAVGDCEILIERAFDAPRKLVWEAMTRPEYLKRWLFGPPGWEMTECIENLTVGGKFRYAWKHEDGREMAMSGTYREIIPHDRIVRTESFEFGCVDQGGQQIGTMTLVEKAGKTQLTISVLYPNRESRDGMIASGMESGMAIGYERLDEILASLS